MTRNRSHRLRRSRVRHSYLKHLMPDEGSEVLCSNQGVGEVMWAQRYIGVEE